MNSEMTHLCVLLLLICLVLQTAPLQELAWYSAVIIIIIIMLLFTCMLFLELVDCSSKAMSSLLGKCSV